MNRIKFNQNGFTLVEILLVIIIISLLYTIIVLIVNPLEVARQGRDAQRLADLSNIRLAMNLTALENSEALDLYCHNLFPPCSGRSTDPNPRQVNGQGWVKMNLEAQDKVKMAVLPVDPRNNNSYYYEYATDNTGVFWEINTTIESVKFQDKMFEGGNNDSRYEIGTKLTILP